MPLTHATTLAFTPPAQRRQSDAGVPLAARDAAPARTLAHSEAALRAFTPATSEKPHGLDDAGIGQLLDEANRLVAADRPKEAAALLEPYTRTALLHESYGFALKVGFVAMAVADSLRDANLLGAYALCAPAPGSRAPLELKSERLDAYIGVMTGFGHFMLNIEKPEQQARFVSKVPEQARAQVIDGVRSGLCHALYEAHEMLRLPVAINRNALLTPSLNNAVQAGTFAAKDSRVAAHLDVMRNPLYDQVIAATNDVAEQFLAHNVDPFVFWPEWHDAALQAQLFELDAYKLAQRYTMLPAVAQLMAPEDEARAETRSPKTP